MRQQTIPDDSRVSVRIPAKLNLFLAVRGSRDDGYHELVTVFQTVSVFDEVRVGFVGPPGRGHHPAARRRMRLELRNDPVDPIPTDTGNLAMRAAQMLGRRTGVIPAPTEPDREGPCTVLDLTKAIPVAGGMAGGSADAAAALLALNRLWGCELSRDELHQLATKIGSDVPFCLGGGTALATGRGTALAQVLCRGTFHWVVCTAAEPLSTADVYASWDRCCGPTQVEADAVLAALRGEDAVALGAALHNELEPAVFALRPELARNKQALLDAGALGAVVSGSGPTLLALGSSEAHAQDLAVRFTGSFRQTLVATSPAGGPEIRAWG